ncbi:hypothetical protein G7Z17_g5292 [Cylindrodendrum hubeiense]|uniref:Uncharacterized protein n=1 Tax=Cylindrodendrum hubeiense TaxID=595255 RepID=A0A9P5HD81_9HYPO|nr:hypothetical protein G7Z17_g5292 [Cylindrodendrum hubeiense]
MSQPGRDGKRSISYDQNTESSDAKRSRVVYVVESPGGTLRETSPSKIMGGSAQPISTAAILHPAAPSNNIGVHSEIYDEFSQLSISEKLHKGIAMSLERERAYGKAIIKGIERNPRLRFQDLQDLQGSMLTITGMQKVADLASHLDSHIHPSLLEGYTLVEKIRNEDLNEMIALERTERPNFLANLPIKKPKRDWGSSESFPLRETNQRLQGVTGISNETPFTPFHTNFKSGQTLMPVEGPESMRAFLEVNSPLSPPEGLLAFLESASRKNGYRKLELGSLIPPGPSPKNWKQKKEKEKGPTRRLALSFKFSKDGTPSFSCSAKPEKFYERPLPEDFLWLDDVAPYEGDPEEWWDYMEDLTEYSRLDPELGGLKSLRRKKFDKASSLFGDRRRDPGQAYDEGVVRQDWLDLGFDMRFETTSTRVKANESMT